MSCDYVEVSVLEDWGIDKLVDNVIEKCMQLHEMNESVSSNVPASIANVKPIMLTNNPNSKRKKNKSSCC